MEKPQFVVAVTQNDGTFILEPVMTAADLVQTICRFPTAEIIFFECKLIIPARPR